ncbi:hypothetical protein EZ428_18545 [Pedobacter frigiditerrae]|uniref:Uncharacterized protein n=1 Tax=Pedobacter frigiditerrae TaxID=2530452 RepID=A0A4R0MQ11_9SPHI|nr:hypothetical protein [Pedobacter frigiditerrae]TCC88637.1 hypothetical protein EZ428_18545 [Pedobacter frigiditerrae]
MKTLKLNLTMAIVCLLPLLTCNSAFAQKLIQDTRGKDVLEFYKGGAIQTLFTPTQTSLEVTYSQVIGTPLFYYINGDEAQKTVGKSHSLSMTGKVQGSGTDGGKPFSISKGLVRPSYRLEAGYQRNLNTFYDITKLPASGLFSTYSAGVSMYGEYQDINLYDTLARVQSNHRPLVYGIHGHFTAFNKHGFDSGPFSKLSWALSFSADLSNSYNSELFIPYQGRTTKTYIDPNIISSSDVLGNIGSLKRSTVYRLRASLPVFVTEWLNLTPYASYYGFGNGSSNWLPGFAVNLFNGAPRVKGGSLDKGFGVAIDWPKTTGAGRSAAVSIYGTLSFDKLKKIIVGEQEQ